MTTAKGRIKARIVSAVTGRLEAMLASSSAIRGIDNPDELARRLIHALGYGLRYTHITRGATSKHYIHAFTSDGWQSRRAFNHSDVLAMVRNDD